GHGCLAFLRPTSLWRLTPVRGRHSPTTADPDRQPSPGQSRQARAIDPPPGPFHLVRQDGEETGGHLHQRQGDRLTRTPVLHPSIATALRDETERPTVPAVEPLRQEPIG